MKHPYILAVIMLNVVLILIACWVSRVNPRTSADDQMGGAFVAVIVGTVLGLVDALVVAVMLIHWLVRG